MHSVSRKAKTGILLVALLTFSTTLVANAGETQIIGGRRYEKSADGRLYPQIRSDWTDLKGVVHTNWVTDYSSAPLLPEQKPNFQAHPPIKPVTGNIVPVQGKGGSANQLEDVTIRDVGDKHFLTINADCLFDFDKSDLNDKAEKVLRKVGPILQKYPGQTVAIEGHTDSIGEEAYNQDLSEKRAATVKNWLVEHGFADAQRVSTKGLGETCPVARNTYTDGTDYPQGRQKNLFNRE